MMTFADGKDWEGEFSLGKMNGKGVMRKADGTVLRKGIWSNNDYVGRDPNDTS